MSTDRDIRRLPCGAIDVDHYVRLGRELRSRAAVDTMSAASASVRGRLGARPIAKSADETT